MKLVFVVSPYSATEKTQLEGNVAYAVMAMRDCFARGEAPYVGHIMYPCVLRDDVPEERTLGMESAWGFLARCDLMVVYTDRGVSIGMQADINEAKRLGVPIVTRQIGYDS